MKAMMFPWFAMVVGVLIQISALWEGGLDRTILGVLWFGVGVIVFEVRKRNVNQ